MMLEDSNNNLRPKNFNEYIGQKNLVNKLKIYIQAALSRQEAMDHVLLFGPAGLGKTTLANIIAYELGVNIRVTSGPAIEKAGDLAAILTNSLEEKDVLFIDEIHRLGKIAEEHLYPAMEDYKLDIVLGQGVAARTIELSLPPFTLIGATTRPGLITAPMRSRFGIIEQLQYYSHQEIAESLILYANKLELILEQDAAIEIAKRSRGTMRIAKRLLRRVRDFVEILEIKEIKEKDTISALQKLGLDSNGLDVNDLKYLKTIIYKFSGGPVGLDTLATAIREDTLSLEDIHEPFLIQLGLIQRTNRGRVATEKAYKYLGLEKTKKT